MLIGTSTIVIITACGGGGSAGGSADGSNVPQTPAPGVVFEVTELLVRDLSTRDYTTVINAPFVGEVWIRLHDSTGSTNDQWVNAKCISETICIRGLGDGGSPTYYDKLTLQTDSSAYLSQTLPGVELFVNSAVGTPAVLTLKLEKNGQVLATTTIAIEH